MSEKPLPEVPSSPHNWLKSILLTAAVIIVVVGAAAVYYLFFYESRNYVDGIKAVRARLYDDAVDKFKICLIDNENDDKAKAMLLVSLGLQSKISQDQLFDLFDRYLTLYVNSRLNYTFSSRDYWNDFRDYNDTQKRAIREVLKNMGIRTESWTEVEKIIGLAAKEVFYRLSYYSEDIKPYVLMSSVLLSMKGDENAQKYLISAAIENGTDVKYLSYPGLEMISPLRNELKNRESLLYTDGMKVLRDISLYDKLISSAKDLGAIRRFYERDFPYSDDYKSTSSYSFEKRQLWRNFNPQLSCFLNTNIDPLIGSCKVIDYPAGHFAQIVTYDDESSNFVAQFFVWSQLDWKRLKVNTNGISYNYLRSKEFPILMRTDSAGSVMFVGYGSYMVKPRFEVKQVSKGFIFDSQRGWRQDIQVDTVMTGSTEEFKINRWDIYDVNSLAGEIRFIINSNDYRKKIMDHLFALANSATRSKTDLRLAINPRDTSSAEATYHLAVQEPSDVTSYVLSKSDSVRGSTIYIVATAKYPGQDAIHPVTMYCARKFNPDTSYVRVLN
ncbi:MAG: hypothetical protein ACP5US_11300 [Candidatus Kryptoniota bacterium]